jgi:hypothetical protein
MTDFRPPLFDTEHIAHVVEAPGPADDPSGGAYRSSGEIVAAVGAMNDLYPFAKGGENDGMLAHDVATSNALDPNLRHCTLSDHSAPPIDPNLPEVSAEGPGDNLPELNGRTAWRVFLEPMVGFHYLYVATVSEQPRRFGHHFEHNIDTDAHVGRNYT